MNRLKCPSCAKPLSFLNLAKAPTPFHLKCDHCQMKLRFGRHAAPIFVGALLFGFLVGLVMFALGLGTTGFLVGLVVVLAVGEMTFFIVASALKLPLVSRDRSH